MLDPLTAISLVGNIVQFIDFGFKIVSKTTETYRSADGVLKENANLEIVANDLISINTILTASKTATSTDPALESLCNGCVEVCTELLAALVQVKAGNDPTKWRSVRKALRSVWSKDKISGLEAQLGRFRDEVNLRIVVSLRVQIEALTLQQSDIFDKIDSDSKLLVDAIRSGQDVFRVSLQLQTQSLKKAVEDSEGRLSSGHTAARDHIIAAVDNTVQSNQVEHETTREEIAQIKIALQQPSEQMERKNEELRDALAKFTTATTKKKKQKLQDVSRAITLTLLALETTYCSLKTLLANIQSHAVVFLSRSAVRQLWGFRSYADQSNVTASPVESGHELTALQSAIEIENTIMRYYASYYFPYFVDGATYSGLTRVGLIRPSTHTKWPIPANFLVDSPSNGSESMTSHKESQKQALDLLNLVLSGSSVGSYSSKAYAFVWLMAIINCVPDEWFPTPGGRYVLFETQFNLQHETADDELQSLRERLKQDLEAWKAIAELSGMSRAFRSHIIAYRSENLLEMSEDESLSLRACEIQELSLLFSWLITSGEHQKPLQDLDAWPADTSTSGNKPIYSSVYYSWGKVSMWAAFESTYQVATFFKGAGIVMSVDRLPVDADGSFQPSYRKDIPYRLTP